MNPNKGPFKYSNSSRYSVVGFFLYSASLPVSMTAATWTFLVMGDWGGQPFWPYTTGAERATAVGMGAVAASSGRTRQNSFEKSR